MAKILIVDGHTRVSVPIRDAMRSRGWTVDVTDNATTAVELAYTGRYRLMVVDMDRPGDSLRLVQQVLAGAPDQKVVVLCAEQSRESGIQVLEMGAADYLARPFSTDELLARVAVRLQGPSAESVWFLQYGDLTLDLARRRADSGQGEVRLTQRECVLLARLIRDPGRVFSRKELLAEVWSDTVDPGSNVVDACVRRLRAKLGDDLIDTVRNVGYSLRVSQPTAREAIQ